MEIKEAFIQSMKELLDSKQISLRKLGKELNISHATLSRWQSGKTMPQAESLCLLADYFNCTVDFLLGRNNL